MKEIQCTATEYRLIKTLNQQGFEDKKQIINILRKLTSKLEVSK